MKIGILTGGGDVGPLNALIHSVKKNTGLLGGEVFGFLKGWEGILINNFINLSKVNIPPKVGGTILKSSRVNLQKVENSVEIVRKNMEILSLDGLIVVGGEDTLSNVFNFPDLPIVMISKTIDNDVGILEVYDDRQKIVNHFTLGHPTAAEKIASFVSLEEGLKSTAYSHERIIFVESMGMYAGWLALSSALGRPDFIIIPEFPINYDDFLDLLIEKYKIQKNIIVVLSEGAKWESGEYISADYNNQDSFGHPKFLGSAKVLCEKVKESLNAYFNTRNINFVNPSYLYRSGSPNKLDSKTAFNMGKLGVELIEKGIQNPIFIASSLGKDLVRMDLSDIGDINSFHRFVPQKFYDTAKYNITQLGREYLLTFAKSIPELKYGI